MTIAKPPQGFVRPFALIDPFVAIGFDQPSEKRPPLIPTPSKHRELATFPRRQFLYGRHYIRKYLSATVAPGGVGKSALVIAEALAMVTGRPLLGVQAPKPLRVWYWNGEDPAEETDRRIEAACLCFRIDPREIEGRLFRDTGRETEIIIAEQTKSGTKIATPVVDALVDALSEKDIDVLILDPFVSTHRVSENGNMAIDAVAKTFGKISDEACCAIELIHHVRKGNGGEITADDSRGAGALVAAARSVRVLNRMTLAEGDAAGVGNQRGFYFRSDFGKANLVPPSTRATWFRLADIGLGNGSGALPDDQDRVGVVTPWQWPDPLEDVTVAHLRAVQAACTRGRWRESSQAKEWAGYAVANVLKLDADDKAARAKIKSLLKMWIGQGALVVVERMDEQRRPRDFVESGDLGDE
jgi:AAA domain